MLVRKIKCPACAGIKINKITTGYIYCDYCGNLMGFDMTTMHEETAEVFSADNYKNELQLKFNAAVNRMAEAKKEKNREAFIQAMVEMHETEFELFPKRYGPKAKQPSYRQRYLNFFKEMYNEKISDDYFDENEKQLKPLVEASLKLTYKIENNLPVYEFDDQFKKWIDLNVDFIKNSITVTNNANYLNLYPEYFSSSTPEIMLKNSLSNMLSLYDNETIKKTIDYLGMKEEYIEIDPVPLSSFPCVLCAHPLQIPDGAKSIVCEDCGTKNQLQTKEIECLNCGASYKKSGEDVLCPSCGASAQTIGRKESKSVSEEKVVESVKEIKTKKKFFARLFGN